MIAKQQNYTLTIHSSGRTAEIIFLHASTQNKTVL